MRWRWTLAGVLLVALILLPFVLFEGAIEGWTRVRLDALRGWPLGLLIAGLLAADLFLPVPSSVVSIASGTLLGFGPGILASFAGMCAGSMIGYAFGTTAGEAMLRRFVGEAEMARAAAFSHRYGLAALAIARAIPVLAEASVVSAGATRMPLARFLAVTTAANLAISTAYAWMGSRLPVAVARVVDLALG